MAEIDATDLETRLAAALAGQYVIVRALGQGGMGTVFLARDVTLDREVAVKVIAPELASSAELRQRFIQEARTVAKLRHPNIVAVYTAGEGNGLLYFVMEFVPGESLRDRMTRETHINSDATCEILRDLSLALDYAHQAGIVHRDVKPENILLDRESGRAMLTDFGVAVALASAGDPRLTGAGFVLGSPRYMSPEQASGERDLDGRSDLYSLGLIGYEMLTGAPAIDAPTAASTLVKQLTERPEPVLQKAPSTPVEVGAAIDRVLLKSPAERFSRGAAFAAALAGETFDDKTPVHQIGRSSASRSSKAAGGKSRRKMFMGGAIALIVAAVAGGVFYLNRDTGNKRMYFIAPFEVQTGDRSLDWLHEGSVNMMSLALSQWTDLSVVDYERSLDLLRAAKLDEKKRIALDEARGIARRAGAGVVIMGTVTTTPDSLRVIARMYSVATGLPVDQPAQSAVKLGDDPRNLFQAISSQLLDLVGGPKVTVELSKATTTSVDAYRTYLDGVRSLNSWRLPEADSLLKRATELDSTFALAYYKRALTLGWINAPDRSQHVLASQKAVDNKARLPQRMQDIVVANNDLAHAFLAEGEAARKLFDDARLRLASLVKSDSLDSEAWYGLADAQFHEATGTGFTNGDSVALLLNQSQRGFRRAIAIDSTNHLAYQHLVGIYQMASYNGNYLVLDGDTLRNVSTEAQALAIGVDKLKALRLAAKTKSRDAAAGWLAADPDARQAYRSLSDAYQQLGKIDSSVAVLERSYTHAQANSPTTPYRIVTLRMFADDPRALASLRDAMRRSPADSLRAHGESDRIIYVLSGLTTAGGAGAIGLTDSLVRIAVETDSLMPGSTIGTQSVGGFLALGMKMGMGLPTSDADKRNLLRSMQTFERNDNPMLRQMRAQSIGIPYMAYLATHDTAFSGAARRWTAQASGNNTPSATLLPELSALEAVWKGDTARAAQLVREFPSVDSMKKSTIGMAGIRLYARALAAAAVGDLRTAVGMYEAIDPKRYGNISIAEPGYAAFAHSFLERGKLYEKLGEPAKAIVAYDEFIRRWKDADAPLQSQVSDAKQAVARLKDSPTKTVPVGPKTGRG
ncbi:MAG: serine/threonine-protein kinase [Gemmatimonas sp.]